MMTKRIPEGYHVKWDGHNEPYLVKNPSHPMNCDSVIYKKMVEIITDNFHLKDGGRTAYKTIDELIIYLMDVGLTFPE